jgi:redox-sensitive bicupin YhaK (pirin superfamily)
MPAVTVEDLTVLPRVHGPGLGDVVRPVLGVTTAPRGFEGEGFPVRRAFAGVDLAALDPFVHMDQMGEVLYAPGEPKGTPWHPHRGFETVTYMIDGVMDHQDSHGGGGSITNGDTQWMTAGSGLLHIETPPEWLVTAGGLFHGVQLWVNLPREQKWSTPRYQDLRSSELGLLTTSDAGALVRIIAGTVGDQTGPGSTHTPMTMVHGSLEPGARLDLPWQVDYNALVYVLAGAGSAGVERRPVEAGQLAVLGRGDFVSVTAAETSADRFDSRSPTMEVLVLGGRPIREPVAWGGPFVMNTRDEVVAAFEDFKKGRMGQVPVVHGVSNDIVEG